MFTYTRRNIFAITLIMSIVLFLLVDFSMAKIMDKTSSSIGDGAISAQNDIVGAGLVRNDPLGTPNSAQNETNSNPDSTWEIQIPSINLIAPIKDGTSRRSYSKLCGTL
ncbi:MAG: hypothetical protein LBL91_03145 [Lachnospiraceae bacterium]|nr:hypothetical protein [Lachnospiraceae bacterium]